jgi:5,10-methylenetetrahydromethanopterin reductase
MLEIWRAGGSNTGATADLARGVEAEGWDGQMFMDSQSLSADPYAQMGAWAAWTERLLLSPGVTNPFTRNLAVSAASIATVQAISGGRAVMGIGRGDSALAYLGYAPVKLAWFETALETLQTLLSGGEVPFEATGTTAGAAPSHEGLSLGARPEAVTLRWLARDLPKVPLDVAATGPKVIAMAARIAERVTFSVGAEVGRMEWAIGVARAAREAAALAPDSVSYGAQVVVVCHPDHDTAMETAMHMAPPLARFQVIQGKTVGPADAAMAENMDAIREGYDMRKHSAIHSKERLIGTSLTPEFVERFAVVGSPEVCTQRLLALRDAGIERLVVVGPGFYPAEWGEARELFAREVIPALRAST